MYPALVEARERQRGNLESGISDITRFTTPAILEMPGHSNLRVHEPFAFYLSDDESDVIEVPAGFITDLATAVNIVLPARRPQRFGLTLTDYHPDIFPGVRLCSTRR